MRRNPLSIKAPNRVSRLVPPGPAVLGTRARTSHRGFTLFELLVVAGIVALLASMIVPMLSDDDRMRLTAASAVMTSDIELAQSLSISAPDTLYGVRLDPDGNRWWVASTKAPETPIIRIDNKQSYLVTLGADRASAATGVTYTIDQIAGNFLAFDARGGLKSFTNAPLVQFNVGTQWVKLAINPNTGSITETIGTTPAPKGGATKPIQGGGK